MASGRRSERNSSTYVGEPVAMMAQRYGIGIILLLPKGLIVKE